MNFSWKKFTQKAFNFERKVNLRIKEMQIILQRSTLKPSDCRIFKCIVQNTRETYIYWYCVNCPNLIKALFGCGFRARIRNFIFTFLQFCIYWKAGKKVQNFTELQFSVCWKAGKKVQWIPICLISYSVIIYDFFHIW